MALITCPECQQQISDHAAACPKCGYVLSSAETAPTVRVPQPTRLGAQEKNMAAGGGGSCGGMLLFGLGIPMLFLFLPAGIGMIAIGIVVLSKGNANTVGHHKAICPYCGKEGDILSTSESYRCPACTKRSVKKGDYLHPVL